MKKEQPPRHPLLKPKAVAVAVAVALSAPAHAQWGASADVFVKHGNQRTIGGIEALLPLRQDAQSLFFADIKANRSSQDTNEFNLGLGYRQLVMENTWAVGAYGAWDRRRSPRGNDFNQATLGIEARSHSVDLRTNYYLPTTDKKLLGLGGTNHFAGFGVWRNGIYEEAMRGFDVEAGVLLPLPSAVETRLYLAGYSFKGEDVAPKVNGYRARLVTRINENMSVGLSTQHDGMFGTAGFVEFRYSFGTVPKKPVRTIKERMNEAWTRDIDSCRLRREGFLAAGVPDPTPYVVPQSGGRG